MQQKTTQIIIRMTEAEKAEIESIAREHGVTMSEYARAILLDKQHLSKMVAAEVARQLKIREEVINSVNSRPDEP